MKTHIDRLWQASDFLFLTGLAVALFLGSKVTPLLVIVGVLPIPFLLHTLKNRHYHVSIWTLLAPFGIYFAYSLSMFYFFTGLEESDPLPVNPSLEFYSIAIAMLAIGLVRGLQIRNLANLFRRLMPWLLVACFAILTFLMFAGIRDGCRVRGLTPWPFVPPLLFSTLTFICLVEWAKMDSRERWLRVGLLALGIVVSTTYTGSRGVAVAQAVVFLVLTLLSFLPSLRESTPRLYHLIAATIAGTLISVVVGMATDCGPAGRFSSTFEFLGRMTSQLTTSDELASHHTYPTLTTDQAAQTSAPAATAQPEAIETSGVTDDASIGQRLAMWEASIAAIKQSPVFGHGSLYLQKLITSRYGYEHNHNQYLTWLVTGGLLHLTLGLLFIAIPWFVSKGLSTADRLVLTTGVSLFWGVAMMFDSFLNLKFYTHYFCLLCGVLYALSNSMQERTST